MGAFKHIDLCEHERELKYNNKTRNFFISLTTWIITLLPSVLIPNIFFYVSILIGLKEFILPILIIIIIATILMIKLFVPVCVRHEWVYKNHPLLWKHFIITKKYYSNYGVATKITIAKEHNLDYANVDEIIINWLNDAGIAWHIYLGKIYFRKEEDVTHFILTWG